MANDALSTATNANIASIRNSFRLERSYNNLWKQYKEFVTAQVSLGNLERSDKFLTREGVDLFFSSVVAKRGNIQPTHARKYVSALQKVADGLEHVVNRSNSTKFVVMSNSVSMSLDAQQIAYMDAQEHHQAAPGTSLKCPHSGVRVHVCTNREDRQMMEYCYAIAKPEQSHHLAFTWTWGRCTFLRGVSMRVLQYNDIITCQNFGPFPSHELNKYAVCLILRQGKKDI